MFFHTFLNQLKDSVIFWGLLLLANIVMFLVTILISRAWTSYYHLKTLPVLRKDVVTAIFIVMVNVVVAVPRAIGFKS